MMQDIENNVKKEQALALDDLIPTRDNNNGLISLETGRNNFDEMSLSSQS